MRINPVDAWPEVLYSLCYGQDALVEPKRIARRLHRSHDYLWDICRRDRVDLADPMAACNEILREAETLADPIRLARIAAPIFHLLTAGTYWHAIHLDVHLPERVARKQLCQQTGILLRDLAAVVQTIEQIEDGGVYDDRDDVAYAELDAKAGMLNERLAALMAEAMRRRDERVVP